MAAQKADHSKSSAIKANQAFNLAIVSSRPRTSNIPTVNGHSYDSQELKTNNTNFALLVSKTFSEPFKDSNSYGESIAKLSNMLGGGVIVQRFGDLVRGRRSNETGFCLNVRRRAVNS